MEQNQNKPRNPRRRTPYQRNRRQQAQWLSWLLIGVVVLFLLLGLMVKDREFSETENRSLAQFPTLSLSTIVDGSFYTGLGDYIADQFPGRDTWISINLWLNQLLGQKEFSGVYLCEDDYLMQVPSAPNEVAHERNLEAMQTFAQNHEDLNVVAAIIPNAVTIHADKLPQNAPVRDQAADLAHIRQSLSAMTTVDVTDALMAHKDEVLFYKTDHHWTSLGACYAFTEIAPSLNIEPPELDSYTSYVVSTGFEGTLSSKSGSHTAKDTVEIYVPSTTISYYVTYNEDSATDICSMYNRAALSQKDHYTVFFGGNYSRVDITTTADTGKNLLLFKDSYANCFVQFLYPYFDHITMIDPRYYYDGVEAILTSEGITDVLYLYNLDTFLSDTSLADVLETGNDEDLSDTMTDTEV